METSSGEKTILEKIVAARRESIAHRKRVLPDVALKLAAQKAAPPCDFAAALSRHGYNVIAELKKGSPSRGIIRADYAPAALAPLLEAAGAAALSVLTEEEFFFGSLADLKAVKKGVHIPILRKDFIIDPWQVWETRAVGADAFLLIVGILEEGDLCDLLNLGRSLGMEPLVEVHSREELRRALGIGARIIGVNNRDLRDFRITLETSLDLIDEIPDECVAVSESGLNSHEDMYRLRDAGFDAFLIGEHLMKQGDPAAALSALVGRPAGSTDGSSEPPDAPSGA
jgi:indole-3-glycerol phosphate synthase